MTGKTTKIVAVVAVLIVVIAAVAAVALNNSDDTPEKKGLYTLDAKVVEVSMGQCSATPSVVLTMEKIYESYYGKLDEKYTIADAKADTQFWNTYMNWTSLITDNGDGTFNVKSETKAHKEETVTIPKVDTVISIGTMYTETIYFLLCQKYGLEPYTKESLNNESIKNDLRSMISGGMDYSYYEQQDVKFMLEYIDKSTYIDLGVNSVQKIDAEKLTSAIKKAQDGGKKVLYMASGSRMSEDKYYVANTAPCKNTGAYYAFFAPTTFADVCSCIQVIGKLMGFDESVINSMIEDFQVTLYNIYKGVQEKSAGEKKLAYWESGTGKSVKSAMATTILQFLGFDASLLDGAEHDLESLIRDKPSVIIFYDNDTRSMDEKMRA